ncbi:MAG TPA: response regulator [Verrucomicrobiae bacterium]|jgi:CheY-like chemotaxis protein|nr:response regulator [Verrucomicrobiae bacterium]
MKSDGVIFLLENSTDYLFLLEQAFRKAQVLNPLRVARYGNEAILYLKGVGIYGDRVHYPLPQLVVLDLAIPDGSGLAVLGWIRRQPEFNAVPIIILIHSTQNRFLQDAFDKGANACYVKREDFEGLSRMIKTIELTGDQVFKRQTDGRFSLANNRSSEFESV